MENEPSAWTGNASGGWVLFTSISRLIIVLQVRPMGIALLGPRQLWVVEEREIGRRRVWTWCESSLNVTIASISYKMEKYFFFHMCMFIQPTLPIHPQKILTKCIPEGFLRGNPRIINLIILSISIFEIHQWEEITRDFKIYLISVREKAGKLLVRKGGKCN